MIPPSICLRAGELDGALVFLHGFTGAPEAWADVVAMLAPPPTTGAMLAVALPGHRGEGEPLSLASFEEGVGALADTLAGLGVSNAQLVGYSLGGRFALGLLAHRPAAFARATLIGASPGLEDIEARELRRASDERWARYLEQQGLVSFVDAWEREPVLRVASEVPRERLARQRQQRLRHSVQGLAYALRRFGLGEMPNLWPELPSLEVPVTLVVGGEDAKFRGLAKRMREAIGHAELLVVPGVGHNVPLERPEAVSKILSAWSHSGHA